MGNMFTKWWSRVRGKGKKSSEEHAMGGESLPDFVRGIQHAVNSGMVLYEKNSAAFLDRHLEDDGSPVIQDIKIPRSNLILPVPTMTTTHPPNMVLDEMEVRMSVRINKTISKKAHPASPEGETRSSFQVSVTGSSNGNGNKQQNVIDLTMKFKRGDPPEGVARIMEELVRTITPIDAPEAEPEPVEEIPPPPAAPFDGSQEEPLIADPANDPTPPDSDSPLPEDDPEMPGPS